MAHPPRARRVGLRARAEEVLSASMSPLKASVHVHELVIRHPNRPLHLLDLWHGVCGLLVGSGFGLGSDSLMRRAGS